MTDNPKATAEAVNAYAKLAKKFQGEKSALEVIYSAAEKWTGHPASRDTGLPIVRNGEVVGWISGDGLLGQTSPTAESVAKAVWIEATEDLKKRLKAYKKFQKQLEDFAQTFNALSDDQTAHIYRDRKLYEVNTGSLEEKIIDTIGPTKAMTSCIGSLQTALKDSAERCEAELASRPVNQGPGQSRNEERHQAAIALAKLYARMTGERPTYSQDKNGLHGPFTPILKEVFVALGWPEADLSGPADSARNSISDEDMDYGTNTPMGGILSLFGK